MQRAASRDWLWLNRRFGIRAESSAGSILLDYAANLGSMVDELDLPAEFEQAVAVHRSIMLPEMSSSYRGLYQKDKQGLSAKLRELIEEGLAFKAFDYIRAKERQPKFKHALEQAMRGFDAIITPASTGEAPVGLDTTGNPIFCTIWTLCGMPSLSLPLLKGQAGMPLGVQLVGRAGEDAKLLGVARQLMERA